MKVHSTIRQWGNSLGLRITGPAKTIPQFEAGMEVEIIVNETGIEVHPITKKATKLPFSEKELLKGLNEVTAHADLLADIGDKEFGHYE